MKWWFFLLLKVVMARGRRLKKGGGDLEIHKQNVTPSKFKIDESNNLLWLKVNNGEMQHHGWRRMKIYKR
jgi:hypothetical protein